MKIINYVLLLTLLACAHRYEPVPTEVVVTDPATLPVEVKEPPVIVLDKEPLRDTEVKPPFREVFKVRSTLPYLKEVARISNCIANNQSFINEVEAFPKFTYTDKSSKDVADSIRNAKEVVLSTYRTKNPWSAALAATIGDEVYFNTRRNPRPMPEMIETSIHEGLGHIQGHGHGDNYYKPEKATSVPWALGTIAAKYVGACQ